MARRYHVDPATIVRTIQALGYRRFADFSCDLRQHFVARLTPYTIMKATAREKRSVADHIRDSVERDLENLHALGAGLDVPQVVELAKRIHKSHRILVVGVDLAASLAWFFAYNLRVLGFEAEAPTGSAGNLFHRVRLLTRTDLLVAISFKRGRRETVESVLRARERGVPTFGITDSSFTPIAQYSDAHLIAAIGTSSFAGSYVAPMALLNAVIVACALRNPKRSLAVLHQTQDECRTGARWFEQPPRRTAARHSANGGSAAAGRRSSRKEPDGSV